MDPQTVIPQNLASLCPQPNTPWLIGQSLFTRLQSQTSDKPFRLEEVTPQDPEAQLIQTYFAHQQPLGYSIRQILCIHNPSHTLAFENEIKNIEIETKKFIPQGKNEQPQQERQNTIRRWTTITDAFPSIEILGPKRIERFLKTKILPLWQGTSSQKCESICGSGFTFFGKHHCFDPNAQKGAQASTDIGYFGSGIYFTNSARYATMYSEGGNLLLSWVSMREPYPVVSDVPHPQKCSDMRKLEGKGAYQNYNAHYIPVTSINPQNPQCMEYYPCTQNQIPAWDEIVVFQKAQTLPRFWVKIAKDTIPHIIQDTFTQEWQNNLQQAQAGDKNAQYYMGLCYSLGYNISQDDQAAFPWLQKSAMQDYAPAQYTLSFCYLHAKGIDQDPVQAVEWAQKAATQKPKTAVSSFPSQLQQIQLVHQLAQEQFLEYSNLQDDFITIRRDFNQIQDAHDQLKFVLKKAQTPALLPPVSPVKPAAVVQQVPTIAFGKDKWNTYFGDIGQEPPLPSDIQQILLSPCPFWSGKKVQDTHLLVLIPKTVNGQLLTLANLRDWIQKPKQGNATKFGHWDPGGNENLSIANSYWVLMTRDVLEGTRKKSYADQTQIVSGFRQKTGIDYQPPKLLEVAVCILMEHASKGTRLYSDSPLTYARCQEKYGNTDWQMVMGGFAVTGLVVYHSNIDYDRNGLAPLRKFSWS